MKQQTERDKQWRASQHKANGRKRFTLLKLPPLERMMGGLMYDAEGRLRLIAGITKADHANLFSARRDRLVYKDDPVTGKKVVTDLEEIPLIELGQFYNVSSDYRAGRFYRDDLAEPADSQVTVSIYRNDVVLSSSALHPKGKRTRPPEIWEWSGSTASYEEAQAAGFPEELVRGNWSGSPTKEHGERTGSRKAIKDFTRVSRDRLKFTLRNALCDWVSFVTLTYPAEFPSDGRECKRHLNILLTHMRKDYPGVKYVWFMEFQERGAPHFHLFMTCAIPTRTYISPLWYHIVNSGDPLHLMAGTQVKPLANSSEAIKYATSYANKATQKLTPEAFQGVGRFWGSSRSLTSPIVELTDISIRQLQQLRTTYLETFGVQGRTDRMNCYLWDGASWGASICRDYYNMHIRPLEAELLDIGEVDPLLRSTGASWLAGHDRQRSLGFIEWVRSGQDPCAFPDLSGLDNLRYLRRRKKGGGLSGRPWTDLSEATFAAKLKAPVERLRKVDGDLIHSVASAYGFTMQNPTTQEAFEGSAISLSEWTEYLGGLSERMKLNWHAQHRPLYEAKVHTYVYLSVLGGLVKKTYSMKHA